MSDRIALPAAENQARGLAEAALRFMAQPFTAVAPEVWQRLELFYLDSAACAASALHLGARAPTLLRAEALACRQAGGSTCYGSRVEVLPEKSVVANSSAAREWDSNGTNFGWNPRTGQGKGEFGHNDFYPVAMAAAQQAGLDGKKLLQGMLLIDEIRGRLAEVFSLKDHKIDHVLHGAIASALAYGAMLGASPAALESAVGLVVAHSVPFRAIRHGRQLSDSKGASAALAAESAVLAARRAMAGFVGPADIFRNPEAVFCLADPQPPGRSPFDLELTLAGREFAIMTMHFKLGLYEHQTASAIEGLVRLLSLHPALVEDSAAIRRIAVAIYEPAYHIVADPHKWSPETRQSADHSLPYIVATLVRKAHEKRQAGWAELMLLPEDYGDAALQHPLTRQLMARVEIRHGGPEYDAQYPRGLPTSVAIEHPKTGRVESGLVLLPPGHALNTEAPLVDLLRRKHAALAGPAVLDYADFLRRSSALADKSPAEVRAMTAFAIRGLDAG